MQLHTTSEMPHFSIIVPVYKVEEYLERCIDSILCQSFTDFELLLVDDGSPDRCGEICDKYASEDSRVAVRHKPNGGLSSARNAGLDVARGEYVLFVDSDDYISTPDALETIDKRIRSRGEDIILYGCKNENYFAGYSDIKSLFTLCAAIYVGSLWLAMRRIFKNYYFIAFLVVCSMFTFWAYGVNGVRNGMGAAVFILAMSFANTPVIMVVLVVLALGMHNSIWIMVAAAAISWIYNSSRVYIGVWIACLMFSFFAGEIAQNYLSTFDFIGGSDRYNNYLTSKEYSTGFRFDFILYSSTAVITGYYFIIRREMKDEYYRWIYNIYLLCNAFWILVIRASYTNRIAQISWFIMPLVLIYPLLKERHWENHEKMLGIAILLIYSYTFIRKTIPSMIVLLS